MQEKIDLILATKVKISQISLGLLLSAVQKLRGDDLRVVYSRFCSDDALLRIKNNGDMLRRRICCELQRQRHGGLSVRHYNVLYKLDKTLGTPILLKDKFRPEVGTVFTRRWQGKDCRVYVRDGGYEYNGKMYGSLSKIAKIISGHERSGPTFFGLRASGLEKHDTAE